MHQWQYKSNFLPITDAVSCYCL